MSTSPPAPKNSKTTRSSSPLPLLPLPARFFAPSGPEAGSGRVRLPAELGIVLASAVRVRLELLEDSQQHPKRQLSLLCWADVIPRQPEGGVFSFEKRSGEDRETVSVDLKTLSAPPPSPPSPSPSSLEPLSPFLRRGGIPSPPPLLRVVDVRTLGKAGRVPSATLVVVKTEGERRPKRSGGSESGRSAAVSGAALSAVLANALVEVGAVVLPAGSASSLFFFSSGKESPALFPPPLRVVAVEPWGKGAFRIVRSTRIQLL